jgi:solute:Na+ symporter, SSS family
MAGWATGMIYGTIAAYNVHSATSSHWAASSDIVFGHTVYIGFTALALNIIVSVVLTPIFKAARLPAGTDETLPHQYTADPIEAPAPAPAGVGAASD